MYADDVNAEGQVYAHFVRSHDAHGIVRAIDVTVARAMPGVLAVFTGRDLANAGVDGLPYLPLPGADLDEPVPTPRPALAYERVRYVGEQVAVVVAESKTAAMDAASSVDVTIDPLPAVPSIKQALAADAPAIWANAPDNVVLRHRFGDRTAIETAFAQASHVSRLSLVNNRVLANPMEPRAVVARHDGNHFILSVSSQGVNYYRLALTEGTLRLDPRSIRITTPDVGGAFGSKEFAYPEDIAVLFSARALGRPVKWTGTRAEHFLSDNHARDALIDCALALDENGNFLAVDATIRTSLGAYCSYIAPTPPIRNTTLGLPQMYRTPLVGTAFDMVVTNAAPMGPYRGVGREQSALIVERLIDTAAGELGLDPVDLRRRNLIPTTYIPYRTATGRIYESGDFEGLLERLCELADWTGFEDRAEQSSAAGSIRGRGLALFVEPVGGAPFEGASLSFPDDGTVEAMMASQSQGQSHETTLAQVIAEKLGVPLDLVRIVQGDSSLAPNGTGSYASRTMIMAGSALDISCDKVIEKGRRLAAHLWGLTEDGVTFEDGLFFARATNEAISVIELAEAARREVNLPEAFGDGLSAEGKFAVTRSSTTPMAARPWRLRSIPRQAGSGSCAMWQSTMSGGRLTLWSCMVRSRAV